LNKPKLTTVILVLLKTLKEFGHDLGRLASLAKQWQRNGKREKQDFRLSLAMFVRRFQTETDI